MTNLEEYGRPQPEQKGGEQHRWSKEELVAAISDIYCNLSVVKNGKLARIDFLMNEDWEDPKYVKLQFDGGGYEKVTINAALDLLNGTNPQELERLEEARYDGMETDPKDPSVVNNGYCWQRKSDVCVEFGTCSGCGKYWGAGSKDINCTCGRSVSLT
jgi:hypothetical protein